MSCAIVCCRVVNLAQAGGLSLRLAIVAAILLCITLRLWADEKLPPVEKVDFNRQIRPILSNTCWRCHGPDAAHRKADLRLDDFASATSRRDGTTAIVPEKPQESEAIRRVSTADADERMPPS
jgi:hypothetical protein